MAMQEVAARIGHLAGSLSFLGALHGLLRISVAGCRLEWLLMRESSKQVERGEGDNERAVK